MSRFDTHLRRGYFVVFSLIIFFSIIELAISAWLTSRFNAHHNYLSLAVRDRTRFVLFTSIWTIVLSALFMLLFWRSEEGGQSIVVSAFSHALFLSITWVFWTAAAASVTAAYSGGLDCSLNIVSYCGQQNAMEAFAWIIWILVTIALFTIIIRCISAARRGDGVRGGIIA